MSRRAVLGLAIVLAGCRSDGALDIVVPKLDGVTKVRLYIGLGDGAPDAIAPEGFDQYLSPTRWWPLDPGASVDVREVGDASEVVFELARGDSGESVVHVAIVIGYDDSGSIVGAAELRMAEIPSDYIARHTLPLDPALTATTWPAGENTCVALKNPYLDRVEMVVDPSDPDCDGYTSDADECDPYFFRSQGTVRLEDTSCVVETTTLSNGQIMSTCALGGPTCTDGGGTADTCAPSPYCVPHTACTACADTIDCLHDVTQTTYVGPRIECSVPVDANGALCGADYPLDLQNAWPGLPACNTDEQLTRDGITYGGEVAYTFASGDVKVSIQNPQGCAFSLRAEGLLPLNESVGSLITGSFINGRGWAVPVVVSATTGGCDTTVAGCHVEGLSTEDNFVACVTGTAP